MRIEAKVFGNDVAPTDEFDLLIDLWGLFGNGEFAFAFRTVVEFEFDGLVDLVSGEGLPFMLFVSFLCSDLAFSFAFWLGWFNDVGGGGFRGVAGVLFELSDFSFEFGDFGTKFFDESRLFGYYSLPIHK
jgi:hypothetical protein